MKNKNIFGIILLVIWFLNPLNAKEISLSFLNSKPKSIYKDYYIWRYLDQNISSKRAFDLIGDVENMNKKLFLRFCKKIDSKIYKKIYKCYTMKPKEFIKSDADCIKIGFSIYDATKLSKNELKGIENKVYKSYPKFYASLKVLTSKNPFDTLMKSNNDLFFSVFNHVGSKYREKYLDKSISKKKIGVIERDKRFNETIKLIVTNLSLVKLQKSILDINGTMLDANSNFFLAMNDLRYGKKQKALKYLDIANKKFYFRFDKDKVLFWKYLITKDLEILYKLTKSFDINIYTIYAKQKLDGLKSLNITTNLKCKNSKGIVSITDPFSWLKILNKIDKKDTNLTKIADSFKSCKDLPFKAFVLERLNYKDKNYFISPYKKYLHQYSLDKKILLLSIARQESRFIPSSISSSYALGMMQFMPFLSFATAKKENLKYFTLNDMFYPKIAYSFASKHLSYLQSKLHNPLFIAYAYNAGLGFTKKMLKSGLFKKGKYEPYISMELVPYGESRRYGKKVLANYIIYSKIFGKQIDIKTLFQSLIQP